MESKGKKQKKWHRRRPIFITIISLSRNLKNVIYFTTEYPKLKVEILHHSVSASGLKPNFHHQSRITFILLSFDRKNLLKAKNSRFYKSTSDHHIWPLRYLGKRFTFTGTILSSQSVMFQNGVIPGDLKIISLKLTFCLKQKHQRNFQWTFMWGN